MKKTIVIIFFCLLLGSCGQPPSQPTPTQAISPTQEQVIYFKIPLANYIQVQGCDFNDTPCASGQNGKPVGYHTGIDYWSNPAGNNEPVLASAPGKVVIIQKNDGTEHGMGNTVILEHRTSKIGQPIYTLYAHLQEIDASVTLGKCVNQSTQLGLMGESGYGDPKKWKNPPHLHFEFKTKPVLSNPIPKADMYWGYIPNYVPDPNPTSWGYLNPHDYLDKVSPMECKDWPIEPSTIPNSTIITPTLIPLFTPTFQQVTVSPSATSLTLPNEFGEMVLIPAGSFQMGCDPLHTANFPCISAETLLHTVTLDAYLIDKYEITNAQYAQCVAGNGCGLPDTFSAFTTPTNHYTDPLYANSPVIFVSWEDANNYCTWAGKRLPTEAEWEKAARGGDDTRPYPWGDQTIDCKLANYEYGYPNNISYCVGDVTAVGSYPSGASPYGIMDMAGNVSEWVNDWYDDTYYSRSPSTNPPGPQYAGLMYFKVLRGGSWGDGWLIQSVYARHGDGYKIQTQWYGFRCAASP